MEKRILSCLSQGQIVMQPSTDNGSSSQVRRDLPPQDAQSCRLMHLTRKSTCIAYGRVRGLSTEEECYNVIVDEIIEGSVELMSGGKTFQDITLGDTIDRLPIFRTTFI